MVSKFFRKGRVDSFFRVFVFLFSMFFFFSLSGGTWASEVIEFDDGCEPDDNKCNFWKCYETGKCSEQDSNRFDYKSVKKSAKKTTTKKITKKRRVRSLSSSESGLRRVRKPCKMRYEAKKESDSNGLRLREGSRIWTDPWVSGWFKIYHRKGHAFVRQECF